jgi:uncharacterized protein
MDQQFLITRLQAILPSLPEVSLVYLFGSQVEGNTGPLSDVDLGVLIDRETDQLATTTRLAHLLVKALQDERVDIIPLIEAPIELAYAVIAKGICLYERNALTRVEYEAQVLSCYGDYLPVLRAQRQEILRGENDERRVQRYRAALERTKRALSQITASEK